jgi:hypothetical protein
MTSSRTRLFNSVRLFESGSALTLGKIVRVTRNGVWLTILVAGCCSSAFAQHGVQEFTSGGKFQVPPGVSALRVDAYGAGGGGGGADGSSNYGGGGGGGGAYAAGAITVSTGEVLTIVIGSGGAGGLAGNPAGAGSAGGRTGIVNPSKVVIFSANGGKGGQGATGTSPGAGGVGGTKGTFGSIRHAGSNGQAAFLSGGGTEGWGYIPVGFNQSLASNGTLGLGSGGLGGETPYNNGTGANGVPGYILISW